VHDRSPSRRRVSHRQVPALVRGLAYPYGSMDAAARRAVRNAGYDYDCATEPPIADLGIMALPRIGVWQRDGPRRLAAKQLTFTGETADRGRHLEGPTQPRHQVDNG